MTYLEITDTETGDVDVSPAWSTDELDCFKRAIAAFGRYTTARQIRDGFKVSAREALTACDMAEVFGAYDVRS